MTEQPARQKHAVLGTEYKYLLANGLRYRWTHVGDCYQGDRRYLPGPGTQPSRSSLSTARCRICAAINVFDAKAAHLFREIPGPRRVGDSHSHLSLHSYLASLEHKHFPPLCSNPRTPQKPRHHHRKHTHPIANRNTLPYAFRCRHQRQMRPTGFWSGTPRHPEFKQLRGCPQPVLGPLGDKAGSRPHNSPMTLNGASSKNPGL